VAKDNWGCFFDALYFIYWFCFFGDLEYVMINFVFVAGSPIYVSWIANLLTAWFFKKQRKISGFLFLEGLSIILYSLLIIFAYFIEGGFQGVVLTMIGLFTLTLVLNMIIYPLLTFPKRIGTSLNTEVIDTRNLVEY